MSATRACLLAVATVLAAPAVFAADKPDVENGKAVFEAKCAICHASNNEPGGPLTGPSMVGIVGRKAGTQKDFPMYSSALKDFGVKWSTKSLNEFLMNPGSKAPGTTMVMVVEDDKERADVVAYIATLK
jgi:cytochrome c